MRCRLLVSSLSTDSAADLAGANSRCQVDADGLADVGADLEGRSAERAVEYFYAVERRRRRDAVDLIDKLLHFVVQRRAICRRVGGIGGLNAYSAVAVRPETPEPLIAPALAKAL